MPGLKVLERTKQTNNISEQYHEKSRIIRTFAQLRFIRSWPYDSLNQKMLHVAYSYLIVVVVTHVKHNMLTYKSNASTSKSFMNLLVLKATYI